MILYLNYFSKKTIMDYELNDEIIIIGFKKDQQSYLSRKPCLSELKNKIPFELKKIKINGKIKNIKEIKDIENSIFTSNFSKNKEIPSYFSGYLYVAHEVNDNRNNIYYNDSLSFPNSKKNDSSYIFYYNSFSDENNIKSECFYHIEYFLFWLEEMKYFLNGDDELVKFIDNYRSDIIKEINNQFPNDKVNIDCKPEQP